MENITYEIKCMRNYQKKKKFPIPVNMSVTARLKIRILYGLFNIDRFINITRHRSRLPKKERLVISPKEVFIKVP